MYIHTYIFGVKLLSFRLINNYWSNYYIYTYICRRLAQLGVNRNRLQRRREGMKRAAGDFRRASEGKKRGDQQAVVEHISPSLSSSLSLSLCRSLTSLSTALRFRARVFTLSLSLSLLSLYCCSFSRVRCLFLSLSLSLRRVASRLVVFSVFSVFYCDFLAVILY